MMQWKIVTKMNNVLSSFRLVLDTLCYSNLHGGSIETWTLFKRRLLEQSQYFRFVSIVIVSNGNSHKLVFYNRSQ